MGQLQILVVPTTREFSYTVRGREVKYRLSTGKATEGGKPKVYVTRWQAADLLKDQDYRLPRLQETWKAALQDKEIEKSVFISPAELQADLLLTQNTQPETDRWVVKDAGNGAVLKASKTARVLVPTEECFDGSRRIVIANVFDIPDYRSDESNYNPENPETWDPETGFFDFKNGFDPKGQYFAYFPSGEYLRTVCLVWSGSVDFNLAPEYTLDCLGFRGAVNSQSGKVKSDRQAATAEKADKPTSIRARLRDLRASIDVQYRSNLEALDALEAELRADE